MSESLARPRRLEQRLDLSQFRSGAAELDLWLKRFAWENQQANNAVTYVTTMGERVVGYYAITSGSVELGVVPRDLKKGGRPDPLPVLILARLAVDEAVAGRGVGAGLMRDALERCAVISESVGAAALLVHARDESARAFYLHVADFVASPVADLQLMVSMKALRRVFLP